MVLYYAILHLVLEKEYMLLLYAILHYIYTVEGVYGDIVCSVP